MPGVSLSSEPAKELAVLDLVCTGVSVVHVGLPCNMIILSVPEIRSGKVVL